MSQMSLKILLCLPLLFLLIHSALPQSSREDDQFVFNGFRAANLTLDGIASITAGGLLMLTNKTNLVKGHAFHPPPLRFRNRPNGTVSSFSTTFVFGIVPEYSNIGGHGLTFLVSPTADFSSALQDDYLGLFNLKNNGNSTNHVLAIELDTIQSTSFRDINGNHVGIDVNSLSSTDSHSAGYYANDTGEFKNLTLISGDAMQVWVDYYGEEKRLNVTLAPVPMGKPRRPLLSDVVDLSSVFSESSMYVGFSSSTGPVVTSHHYVVGWSFKLNGLAPELDYRLLPPLPRLRSKARSRVLDFVLPIASAGLVLAVVGLVVFAVRRKAKYAELLEDWEVEFGPHRFSYKDLFGATKGFNEKELLGIGGFGRVYKGVLPSSKMEVAVKRVSHESRQGMREFIAEVVTIGRLRHRNLVQLLGYCRRKGELLLVYDYMPNGSLDNFLYDQSKPALDWAARFRIIKGVAAGLLYLHEDWEQVVIHRDIKASNVLLDGEMNGRLGDFGLARLYDHGTDPRTTHVVGTMGYIAPELTCTGKATVTADVFAFGAFVLEVACGRRPVEAAGREQVVLVDWVVENWRMGTVLATRDPRLSEEYEAEEIELVMKLGLLCSHPMPASRPSMRMVVQYLEGGAPLPELSPAYLTSSEFALIQGEGFDDFVESYRSSPSTVVTDTVLSSGQ